jgi:hypothetical protein
MDSTPQALMLWRQRLSSLVPAGPALWGLLLALLTIPPALTRPGVGLDFSWLAGLNLAFTHHLAWGNGLVWTYGPFGFTDFTAFYDASPWVIALAVTLLVHAAFFIILVGYLRTLGSAWWRWALMGAVFLIPLAAFPSVESELTLTAFLLLLMSATMISGRPSVAAAGGAGIALGLLLTVKGTGMVAAAALLITFGSFVLLTRRPGLLVALAGSIVGSFIALWLLAGQSLSNIPAYFRGSYEIVSGYSAAMSLLRDVPFPVRHATLQVAFGALAIASSAVSLLWAIWRRDRSLTGLFMLATPLLFLEFKEGYVRFGNRQLVFYSLAVLIEVLVLLRALAPQAGLWPAVGWLQSGSVALASAVLMSGLAAGTGMVPGQASWPLTTTVTRLASYGDALRVVVSPIDRARLRAELGQQVRDYYQLGPDAVPVGPTTDVLPWDIQVAYGYSLNWRPRSVLQSYQAYTAYLDQLDAAHFTGAAAPNRVLLAFRSIDGRYPLFDEPAVVRALYDDYDVLGQNRDFLILQRKAAATPSPLRTIGSVRAHLGDVVPVPSLPGGAMLYAGIRVPYSPWGRGMALLFQPSELHIAFHLTTGDSGPFRFIPAVAPDGVMLSSYVSSVEELGNLLARQPGNPIASFRVTADYPHDYAGPVDVTFYTSG